MNDLNELIKTREIRFCHLHPDTNQARNALLLLSHADGIIDIQFIDKLCIYISYDVRQLTLQAIEGVLIRLGYHLDNRLIHRMKRALYAYSENTQRDNLGIEEQKTSNTTKIFVKRYANHQHNCRDKRPEHWRKYL
ncbi:MAG: hypothetical protein OEY61_06665 [Gammaproteobacteria bacterium]|nr:hypothetical protein [Gammaproteobacteria bacterium]